MDALNLYFLICGFYYEIIDLAVTSWNPLTAEFFLPVHIIIVHGSCSIWSVSVLVQTTLVEL